MSDQLEEGLLQKAVAGAVVAGAALGMIQHHGNDFKPSAPQVRVHPSNVTKLSASEEIVKMARKAKLKYKIDDELATHIATLAKKHESEAFPKAKDIMQIVGIESSFNPNAKSGLKIDKARGLMQVRPGVWGLNHKKDLATPEQQIQKGAEILSAYHKTFDGDVDKAVHAYNIGMTNMRKGKGLNPAYLEKFKKERELYD